MASLYDVEMHSPKKMTLMMLCDAANDDDGSCFLLVSTLMRRTCLSERAIQNYLKELRDDGLIEIEYRDGRSSVYKINLEAVANLAPPHNMHPRTICTPAQYAPTPAPCAPITVLNHNISNTEHLVLTTEEPTKTKCAEKTEDEKFKAKTQRRAQEISTCLLESGVNTSSDRVEILKWAADKKVTREVLKESILIAKQRKGDQKITSAYLAPIVEDLLYPKATPQASNEDRYGKAGTAKSPVSAGKSWFLPHLESRGEAVGITPNPGESIDQFDDRVSEAENRFKAPRIERREEPRQRVMSEVMNQALAGCMHKLRHR
jgi:DNA-binding transcriptional ArsR family regulator